MTNTRGHARWRASCSTRCIQPINVFHCQESGSSWPYRPCTWILARGGGGDATRCDESIEPRHHMHIDVAARCSACAVHGLGLQGRCRS
jgi:hypothetical protein